MKKTIVMAMMAGVLLGGAAAYAGGSCCGMGDKAGKAGACDNIFTKLNLTAEQQAKLAELKADCNKAGWSAESHAKFVKGVEAMLTPAQLTEWKAACDKMSKKGQCTAKPDSKS